MAKVTDSNKYHEHHLSWGDAAGGPCDHCGTYVADGDGIMVSTYPEEVLALYQRFYPDQPVTKEDLEEGSLDDGRYCSDECLLCDILPKGYEYVAGEIREETE